MSLFIVINVIGNIPLYITLLRPYSPQRQRRIYIRELTIGLGILLSFPSTWSRKGSSPLSRRAFSGFRRTFVCSHRAGPFAEDKPHELQPSIC